MYKVWIYDDNQKGNLIYNGYVFESALEKCVELGNGKYFIHKIDSNTKYIIDVKDGYLKLKRKHKNYIDNFEFNITDIF